MKFVIRERTLPSVSPHASGRIRGSLVLLQVIDVFSFFFFGQGLVFSLMAL
jgi:hypothetical protein